MSTGPVIVEVLGVRGRARLRRRIAELPATLGRALDCEVIIDDPQVSARHARLERDDDGGLWLVDLDSTNGTFRAPANERVARARLERGARFRLGNTVVRMRPGGDPVERTQVAQTLSATLISLVQRRWVVILLLLTVLAWVASSTYLAAFTRSVLGEVIGTGVSALLVLVAWSAGWSVASRMVTGRFRFNGHLASAAIALLLIESWDLASAIGTYILGAETLASRVSLTGDVAVAVWLLYMHLRLATFVAPPRLLRIALGFVLTAALTVGVIARLNQSSFSTGLDFSQALWPPSISPQAATSAERFFEDAEAARDRADALAAGL